MVILPQINIITLANSENQEKSQNSAKILTENE